MPTATNPGYKTSEFYVAIVSGLVGILLTFGVIKPADATAITQETGVIAGAAITLVSAVSYLFNRFFLKRAAIITRAAPSAPASDASASTYSHQNGHTVALNALVPAAPSFDLSLVNPQEDDAASDMPGQAQEAGSAL